VARPEERKFLGFSIANDGSKRRIAPKALAKFKAQIRDTTRRTRGNSLPQVIADLAPYLLGWRGYFGFYQTPRVLTNLEAWIRRRLRTYLWRQWQNGPNRFKELRQRGLPKFHAAVAAARRLVSGACPDIRPSNRRCATRISTVSVFPASTFLPTLNPIEPPWYGPVCPVVWEGWRREVSPYPDLRRLSADNARVSIWPEMAVEEKRPDRNPSQDKPWPSQPRSRCLP